MGYKTPDQLTDVAGGVGEGIMKGLAIFQGFNSIMDGFQNRRDKEVKRNKDIENATVSTIDTVGNAMSKAVESGDTRLAAEYNKQLLDMGDKIKGTSAANQKVRTVYKTWHTLGQDISNDIKIMDEWDSYVQGAESTGGDMSYDFFAKETTKAGLDRAIQKSREDLRGWRKTLTNNNISSLANHDDWIVRNEAMLDRLIQIAGVDGTLPTNASADERRMFIASKTGEGYKTTLETYNDLEKSTNADKDYIIVNNATIAGLESDVYSLMNEQGPDADQAFIQQQVDHKNTMIKQLGDTNFNLESQVRESTAKLNDKAYDWAGKGEKGYNFETENYDDLQDAEKKEYNSKVSQIKALKEEGEDAGWKEPKGGLKFEANGSMTDEDGKLYKPYEVIDEFERATQNKVDFKKGLATTEKQTQDKADIDALGAESFGQLRDASLPTNVADYDLTEEEFNENVTKLNDAHKVMDYHTVIKEDYEKGLKETENINLAIRDIQELRQGKLKNKEIKKHDDEWKATDDRLSKLQKQKRELKIQAGTLKSKWLTFFKYSRYSGESLEKYKSFHDAKLRHDFSQKELDKLELKISSFKSSIETHRKTLKDNIIQP
jgi:hypothetical protein